MSEHSVAMITVSFRRDFERCRLLRKSVERFVTPQLKHYLIVDRRDVPLFRELEGPHVELLAVEDVLPWYIFRAPGARRWWLSLRTLPVRNQILQQLVKLSIPLRIPEENVMFTDSDVTFVRPFRIESIFHNGKIRLQRVPGSAPGTPLHEAWHISAGQMLGLDPKNFYGADYIGNLIVWRKENVEKLHRHIERISQRPWLLAMCRYWQFSEYIVYGIFVDEVLRGASGHFHDQTKYCLEYWEDRPLDEAGLKSFLAESTGEEVAVMISAKAGIPPSRFSAMLDDLGSNDSGRGPIPAMNQSHKAAN